MLLIKEAIRLAKADIELGEEYHNSSKALKVHPWNDHAETMSYVVDQVSTQGPTLLISKRILPYNADDLRPKDDDHVEGHVKTHLLSEVPQPAQDHSTSFANTQTQKPLPRQDGISCISTRKKSDYEKGRQAVLERDSIIRQRLQKMLQQKLRPTTIVIKRPTIQQAPKPRKNTTEEVMLEDDQLAQLRDIAAKLDRISKSEDKIINKRKQKPSMTKRNDQPVELQRPEPSFQKPLAPALSRANDLTQKYAPLKQDVLNRIITDASKQRNIIKGLNILSDIPGLSTKSKGQNLTLNNAIESTEAIILESLLESLVCDIMSVSDDIVEKTLQNETLRG
jgi:hypothetical protein